MTNPAPKTPAPFAPAGPVGPAGPVAPAAPVTPIGPVGPDAPAGPKGPEGPVAPAVPRPPGRHPDEQFPRPAGLALALRVGRVREEHLRFQVPRPEFLRGSIFPHLEIHALRGWVRQVRQPRRADQDAAGREPRSVSGRDEDHPRLDPVRCETAPTDHQAARSPDTQTEPSGIDDRTADGVTSARVRSHRPKEGLPR